MRVPTMISVNKFCAMLCIALALVFAGASLASAVDRMQHGPGGSPAHEHMLFSDISLEDAHDQDHHQPDQGGEDPSDRLAGGHHHGDSGSGLIILASADATVAALLDEAHGLVPDRRSEEHTSELQSLMRSSYAVFCFKKQKEKIK